MSKTVAFFKRQQEGDLFWIVLICLVCLLVMLALPLLGIQDGYDIAQHLKFAAAYKEAILDGSLVPVWAGPDNLGFGSVGIRFYPPLADYLLATTQLITNDWYSTMEINSIFWMFPGCIAVYLWAKEFCSKGQSAATAMLYAVMPYHLLQIYDFSLYSEFAASAILPFCFLFATKLIRRGNSLDVLGLSISCSLLVLTHIPSSMIGLSGLGIYTAIMIDWRDPLKTIAKFGIAAGLSVASASYFLLRLITEVDWVKHSLPQFSTGFYDHRSHFFPLIWNFGETYWVRFIWVIDATILLTLAVFLPLVAATVLARRSPWFENDRKKFAVALLVVGLFSVFMLSQASGSIWTSLPFLEKIQFPWRFLSVTSLIAPIGLVVAAASLLRYFAGFDRVVLYALGALILCVVLYDFTQTIVMAPHMSRDQFFDKVVNKPEDDFCICWWPVWAKKGAWADQQRVNADGRQTEIIDWTTNSRVITVGQGMPTNLRVATFYYPYWKAKINDRESDLGMDENGVIIVPIPTDMSRVQIYFEEPVIYGLTRWVSFSAWALVVTALCLCLARKSWRNREFGARVFHKRFKNSLTKSVRE